MTEKYSVVDHLYGCFSHCRGLLQQVQDSTYKLTFKLALVVMLMRSLGQFQTFLFTERFLSHQKAQKVKNHKRHKDAQVKVQKRK